MTVSGVSFSSMAFLLHGSSLSKQNFNFFLDFIDSLTVKNRRIFKG